MYVHMYTYIHTIKSVEVKYIFSQGTSAEILTIQTHTNRDILPQIDYHSTNITNCLTPTLKIVEEWIKLMTKNQDERSWVVKF